MVRFLGRQTDEVWQQVCSSKIKKSFYFSLLKYTPMAANIEQDENDVCRQPRRSIVLHITLALFIKLNIGNRSFICL